jgi:hypothetical protein
MEYGTDYPNATGHDDGAAEQMPNFETSTLFILLYAYQKFTGDTKFVQQYMPLLNGYAAWLADHSRFPAAQLMNIDTLPAVANQTLLSTMSTIALKAASKVTGNSAYAQLADANVASIYYNGLGLDGPTPKESKHFTTRYGKDDTWSIMFPAFADIVLNLSTFPAEAYAMQSRWYEKQMKADGLPFASLGHKGKTVKWGITDISMCT